MQLHQFIAFMRHRGILGKRDTQLRAYKLIRTITTGGNGQTKLQLVPFKSMQRRWGGAGVVA